MARSPIDSKSERFVDWCMVWEILVAKTGFGKSIVFHAYSGKMLQDPDFQGKVSLVAIDECHVLSQWKEFRSEYVMIHELRLPLLSETVFFLAALRHWILKQRTQSKGLVDFEKEDQMQVNLRSFVPLWIDQIFLSVCFQFLKER